MSHYTSVNCLAKWWDMYDSYLYAIAKSTPKDPLFEMLSGIQNGMLNMATKEELRLCHEYLSNDDIDNITGVNLNE